MEREKPYWFSECLKNCVAHWLAKKLNLKIGGKVPGKEENEAVEKVEETKVEPKTVSVLDRLEANFNAGSFQDACKTKPNGENSDDSVEILETNIQTNSSFFDAKVLRDGITLDDNSPEYIPSMTWNVKKATDDSPEYIATLELNKNRNAEIVIDDSPECIATLELNNNRNVTKVNDKPYFHGLPSPVPASNHYAQAGPSRPSVDSGLWSYGRPSFPSSNFSDDPEFPELVTIEDSPTRSPIDRDLLFENVFKKRRPCTNDVFISEDPEENDDINDPRWETIKNLKNDEERKKYAMGAFGNLEPADPTRIMTFHGFLRSQERAQRGLDNLDIVEPMEYTANTVRIKDGMLEFMEEGHEKKRKAFGEHEDAPLAKKRRLIPVSEFKHKLSDILLKYRRRSLPKKDLTYVARHWNDALNESSEFLQYYDESNSNLVDQIELEKSECIEMLYGQFTLFYGPNRRVHCKECSHDQDTRICHSF